MRKILWTVSDGNSEETVSASSPELALEIVTGIRTLRMRRDKSYFESRGYMVWPTRRSMETV